MPAALLLANFGELNFCNDSDLFFFPMLSLLKFIIEKKI